MSQVYGNGTTTSTNGSNVRVDALREKAIRAAKKEIIFEQLCDNQTMPLNYGKTLKVHKTLYILDDLNVNDQGLGQDGLVPGAGEPNENGNLYGSSRSVVDVSAGMPMLAEGAGRVNRVGMTRITREGTLIRMGAFLEYTDEVELFSDQKMEIQYYEKMGELAAELYDDYLQKELLGAAGVELYGGVATSISTLDGNDGATASTLAYDLIRQTQVTLRANYAKKTTSIITGSTKVGTVPVNASYFAYCGPTSTVELEKLQDDFSERAYTPARMYAASGNLAKGEVGAVHSTRFIEAERMMKYDGGGTLVSTNAGGYQTTTLTPAQAIARGVATTFDAATDYVIGDVVVYLTNIYVHTADVTAAAWSAVGRTDLGTTAEFFDGFPIIYVTKGAFATIGLQGNKKIKFLSKKPSQEPTQADPYALMGLYSFNFFAGSIVLEPEKIARIVHIAK